MNNNKTNPYKGVKIEYHIIQSFPVSCLNRDASGMPKKANIGGVSRARISSQCWKRQIRKELRDLGVSLGERTKLIEMLVYRACIQEGANEEQAKKCGDFIRDVFIKSNKKTNKDNAENENENSNAKTDSLIFISHDEVKKIAMVLKENSFDPYKTFDVKEKEEEEEEEENNTRKDKKKKKKEQNSKNKIYKKIAEIIGDKKNYGLDGVDIALFGRMVAQCNQIDVEAAASFSHAISTHRVINEIDFFTAVDDLSTEQGSGHLGMTEYNSATYYRYISLNLGKLYENLGGMNIEETVKNFTKALYLAIPAARQTTMSASCPWDYAQIYIRKGQNVQVSFETPVDKNNGYVNSSIKALKEKLETHKKNFGSLWGGITEIVYPEKNIDEVIKEIVNQIKQIGE